jgi:tetratricopeptide (TPR) repeat protein
MPTREELYDAADKLKSEGKLEEAVARLEECLVIDPDYALAHSAVAVLLPRLRRFDEAIQHALRGVELEPRDPRSYTLLSMVYQRGGRIPEAEEAMARARMVQQGMA